MIKSIIWDFDGVIVDSVKIKSEAFYQMYVPYGEEVAQKALSHHLAHGGVSRFEKFKLYHREFLGIDLSEAQIKTMANEFSDLVLNKVSAADAVVGVMDFLSDYQAKYDFFIVTGTPEDEIKEILKRRKIDDFFKVVLGSPKNKTECLNILMQEHGVGLESSVFVGDASTDLNAARNVGMKFVLRDNDDNRGQFDDYAGIRVSDFLNFDEVIKTL